MDYVALGKRIQKFRKSKLLTQAELAEITGYSDSYIGQVEHARTKPSLEAFVKIANALDVNTDQLLMKDAKHPERIYMKDTTERLEKYSISQRILLCEMISKLLDTFEQMNQSK